MSSILLEPYANFDAKRETKADTSGFENESKRVFNSFSSNSKSTSIAVPNKSTNNLNSDYSPRIARSYYKNESSLDENSQPSSFTSSFLYGQHKNHRNHFYSHYVNGLVKRSIFM